MAASVALLLLSALASSSSLSAPMPSPLSAAASTMADPLRKVRAFQKIRHPNDIMNGMRAMVPTRIGMDYIDKVLYSIIQEWNKRIIFCFSFLV